MYCVVVVEWLKISAIVSGNEMSSVLSHRNCYGGSGDRRQCWWTGK